MDCRCEVVSSKNRLQDKEFVKRGHNLDYRLWITCFVAKSKKACVDWQRDNMVMLDKLSQKYSVNVKQYKQASVSFFLSINWCFESYVFSLRLEGSDRKVTPLFFY